ncbi:hypothetical protein FACS1894187_09360 [Synergistales bacterium]|nr:hypothetical protein FACS1894187_09360 [Synergistales bacterium]
MSDVRQMEAELQSLTERLRRERSEMDRVRRDIERENQQNKNSTAQALNNLKRDMETRHRELLRQTQDTRRELDERSRRLEKEAGKIKNENAARERVSDEEARKSIDLAFRVYVEIDKTPHKLFFPSRLNIFHGAIDEAENLRKMGMNEAASAVSVSARFNIERLGLDVKDKQEEWESLFASLCEKTKELRFRLEDERLEWTRFIGGREDTARSRARSVEIDYWSMGDYFALRRDLRAIEDSIAPAVGMGLKAYLRSGAAVGADALRTRIDETEKLNIRFDSVRGAYKIRYQASCQRAKWAESIVDFLTGDVDLIWLKGESGWRQADFSGMSDDDKKTFREYMKFQYKFQYKDEYGDEYDDEMITEDTRESLTLVFKNSAGARVVISVTPKEHLEDFAASDTLEASEPVNRSLNRVLLYVEGGADTKDLSRELHSHTIESLSKEEYVDEQTVALVQENPAPQQAKASQGATGPSNSSISVH